ncbi:protein-glutamine gamma-glutamyltransferase [Paenibacillus hamazuiensis]|uniref:protein-glutamine gamma-glutamyltransferase n=1 Tax=Paenibacillus hamazuiensis TaxID=2936508 RepID=UPI00200FB055|nr:protein-glutamine gamma-glutamyltransferase [Paenibacillus hamazuiensis]
MIFISGVERDVDTTSWPQLAKAIYEQKRKSPVSYHYFSVNHLRFEMNLRNEIVTGAKMLNQSGARFASFKNAHCNEAYWKLTAEGGFSLKEGVSPAAGIRDIFHNGRLYGFECATAVVIVLYKGVLESIKEIEFNRLFAKLLIYDWHYNSNLRLIDEHGSNNAYPGDILYFKNPDVSPETPQWQGENVVKIGEDLYYGHGIGIVSSEAIINKLNTFRIPGSSRSAYLLETITYPDFLYLSQFSARGDRLEELDIQNFYMRKFQVVAKIGNKRFISN